MVLVGSEKEMGERRGYEEESQGTDFLSGVYEQGE